uniref:Bromo domain-containing protein n=1 Tax=Heterorhabditis bacteriophora TaxID=37862 RepID=A0A1I7XA45_HETBA
MPTISSEALESIAKRAGFDITDIIQYWYMKRKSRCGVPLIRRLQTARLLSEQVKKRELHKKSHVRTSHDIFEAVFLPYSFIIDDTLERLCHKDKHCVRIYSCSIHFILYIYSKTKLIAEGKYDSIGAMRTDFLLMTDNCEKFNKTHEWYLKYGRKFRKIGLGLLETAERRIRDMEKLQIGGDVILSEVSRVNYYESNDEDSCVKENEPDTDDERPELRNSRRISASEATDLKRPTTINNIDLGGFLTPRDSGKGMFTFNGTTPKSKRKNDQEATPALKRRKKDSMALSPFRQAPITKFFATSPVILSDRRSTLRHAAPAPLMAFRENSVTSPLPADVASSESSTEEYETRPNRRSARRGDHAKIDIQEASDPEGYHHNDLVVVDGIAGRCVKTSFISFFVIDPVDARVDGDLPKALVSECRLASRKDSQICVFLFENENKWGWYPSCDVRLLNLNGNDGDGLSTTSYKLAKKWQKQMVEVYNK